MPRTIAQGFATLRTNLEITGLQASTVSTRQTVVRQTLESRIKVLNSFLVGSYARSTMIAPLAEADIDILVILEAAHFRQDGQAALLDLVCKVLKERYPSTRISRNGQAATIHFMDFYVDVVPAFHRKGGGYLIPDCIRRVWISTDPIQHINIWANANKAHDGNLVPLIKMIKAWNREHSSLLRSFHLETIVLSVLDNIRIFDFPSGSRFVFDKGRAFVRQLNPDPAGFGGDVGAYLATQDKTTAVVERLETAYQRALQAEALEAAGRTADAFAKWQMIFGKYFPAYG